MQHFVAKKDLPFPSLFSSPQPKCKCVFGFPMGRKHICISAEGRRRRVGRGEKRQCADPRPPRLNVAMAQDRRQASPTKPPAQLPKIVGKHRTRNLPRKYPPFWFSLFFLSTNPNRTVGKLYHGQAAERSEAARHGPVLSRQFCLDL
jgi:hypothetical protein